MERIFASIRDSHFVVFVASEHNPNVYYEAGYAVALGKNVIMCAPQYSDLPFDVRGDNCLAYKRQIRQFEKRFENLLTKMRFP